MASFNKAADRFGFSEAGEGTTITIYLPRVDAGVNLRHEAEPAPGLLRGTETILVAEDQDQLRRMAGRVLRSYGYRVLEAANAGEALLHSERYAGPIHLLLTDVVMPGMTGFELAGRLKPLRQTMEVIFMSGYSERVVTDRLELADSYLEKPFSPEALAGKVRGVLGPPRPAGTILVVDDEPEVRSFLRKVLTGVSYQVLEAENGREAARQIETPKSIWRSWTWRCRNKKESKPSAHCTRSGHDSKSSPYPGNLQDPCCVRRSTSAPKHRSPNPFRRMSCWARSHA
jgi:CheY-like chemotaxis protein